MARQRPLWRADYDLADMGGALQHPKPGFDIGVGEHRRRQRPIGAAGHAGADIAQQPLRQFGPGQWQLVHIDGEIGHVLPHRPQCRAPVFHEIALAEFDEAPERPHQPQAAIHERAGQ